MIHKVLAIVVLGVLIVGGIFIGIPYGSFMAESNHRVAGTITVDINDTPCVTVKASYLQGRGSFSSYLGEFWGVSTSTYPMGNWSVEYSVRAEMPIGSQGDVSTDWLLQETRVFTNSDYTRFNISVIAPDQGFFIVTATVMVRGSTGLIDTPLGEAEVLLQAH